MPCNSESAPGTDGQLRNELPRSRVLLADDQARILDFVAALLVESLDVIDLDLDGQAPLEANSKSHSVRWVATNRFSSRHWTSLRFWPMALVFLRTFTTKSTGVRSDMERHLTSRLLIAEDHMLVAEACRNILEPEFDVVGIVNDGRAMLDAAAKLKPDVIIVDIGLPLLSGLDAGEQVKQRRRKIKLVYLTMDMSPEMAAEAFRRGASAYVPKHAAASELITAVREVVRGTSYLSPLIAKEHIRIPSAQKKLHSAQNHDARTRSAATARQRAVHEGSGLGPEDKAGHHCVP